MDQKSKASPTSILKSFNKESTPPDLRQTLDFKTKTTIEDISTRKITTDNEKSSNYIEATDTVKKAKSVEFLIDIFDPIADDEDKKEKDNKNTRQEYGETSSDTTLQAQRRNSSSELIESSKNRTLSPQNSNEEDKTQVDSDISTYLEQLVNTKNLNENPFKNGETLQSSSSSLVNSTFAHIDNDPSSPLLLKHEENHNKNELAMIKSLSSSSSSLSSSASFAAASFQRKEETFLETATDKQERYNCFNSIRNKRRPHSDAENDIFNNNNNSNEKQYFNNSETNSRKKNKLNSIADGLLMKKENSFMETNQVVVASADMDQADIIMQPPVDLSSNNDSVKIDNEIEDLFSTSALANLNSNEDNSNFTKVANSFYQPSLVISTTTGVNNNKASPNKILQSVKSSSNSQTLVTDQHVDSFSMKLAFNFSINSLSNEQNKIFIETVSENVCNYLKFTQVNF
jgi:hypothetical protein